MPPSFPILTACTFFHSADPNPSSGMGATSVHVSMTTTRAARVPSSRCPRSVSGRTLIPVEAEPAEGSLESWARRSRFTAVVTLVAGSIALVVIAPGVGGRLGGVLMVIAGLWYWLPVVLRSRRKFAEGYRSEP